MLAKRVNSSKTKSSQNFGFYSPSLTDATSNSSAEPTLSAEASLNEGVLAELTGAFEKLVSFIPQLRLASPYEYEQALSDILSKQFKHDELAMKGFIRVIINSMDKTLITEYIDRTIENESKDLLSESPFRIALVKHHLKWMDEVMYSLGINKAKSARRIELATLEKSLDATQYKLRGQQKTIKLFPDDNLIKVVEEILAKGITFSTELWGLPIASSLSFDSFLSELEAINLQRLEGKLKAHAPTMISVKTDLAELLRALLIQQDKILRSPSYQYYQRSLTLAKQGEDQSTLVARHSEEKCEQEKRIRDLEQALEEANKKLETFNLVKQKHAQLKRMNTHLRHENAYLNRQMIHVAQETDRSEVLSLVKEALTEKPYYAQCRLFDVPQTDHQESVERSSQVEKNNATLIALDDTHYVRQSLPQNTDTPFSVFGLNRVMAYKLLRRNINEVRENIKCIFFEPPIANEDFVKSLSDDFIGLKTVAAQYFAAKKRQDSNLAAYARSFEPYMRNSSMLDAYIDYDVKYAQVDDGWCHPLILGALADLLDISLSFYTVNERGKTITHPVFQGNEIVGAKEHLQLLITQGYHFEHIHPLVTMRVTEPNPIMIDEEMSNSAQNANQSLFG